MNRMGLARLADFDVTLLVFINRPIFSVR